MSKLNTSLLREKFVIKPLSLRNEEMVTATSNRIDLPLYDREGQKREHFIIRAQNMHQTTRMMARILTEYRRRGPLMKRTDTFSWDELWDSVLSDFERFHNEQLWISVYSNGKPVFAKGKIHPLLDLIEKCAFDNPGNYDSAIKAAEDMFSKAGKDVAADYDGNVALVIDLDNNSANFGIILRAADRTTTFKFLVKPHDDDLKAFNYTQSIMAAAAFLEGIQLSFTVGMNKVKIIYGHIDRHSQEEKLTNEGVRRIEHLQKEIESLQISYLVSYRPEKPNFNRIISDAEILAEGIFQPVKD